MYGVASSSYDRISDMLGYSADAIKTAPRTLEWSCDLAGSSFQLFEGDTALFEEGLLHNIYGPAVVRIDGTKEYWIRGVKMDDMNEYESLSMMIRCSGQLPGLRTIFDGYEMRVIPTFDVTEDDGSNKMLDNDSGQTIVTDFHGTSVWSVNGVLTRDDGPAVFFANGTQWYLNAGHFHRTDGPAIVWTADTDSKYEYWLDGKQLTHDEFASKTSRVSFVVNSNSTSTSIQVDALVYP